LTDVEIRYRQRYLDLIVNPIRGACSRPGAASSAAIREFMTARGYLEVETPIDAADRRRRDRASFVTASQRARHGSLPAHRTGATT